MVLDSANDVLLFKMFLSRLSSTRTSKASESDSRTFHEGR